MAADAANAQGPAVHGPQAGDPLEDILRHAPTPALVVDASGRVRLANARAAGLFGTLPGAIAGTHFADLVSPETWPRVEAALHAAPGHPDEIPGSVLELAGRRSDGTLFPVEAMLLPLGARDDDGALLLLRDITDRRAAEAELTYKKALLESQNESSVDGILIVDHESNVVSMNQRFLEMWGVDKALLEVGGRDDEALESVLDRLEDPDEFLKKIAWLHEHPSAETRDEVRFRDGRVFERWSTPVFSADGTYYGRGWYFRDITERKEQEHELKRAYEQLRELEASRGQLIHNISHDLATPLTPIRFQLRLLERALREGNGEARRALEIVHLSVEQLARLVSDLKDVSRIQGHRLTIEPEPLDLAALVVDAVASFAASAEDHGIHLEHRCDEPLPVNADRARITQVLFNLITNALKFTPHGGRVTVTAGREGDEAVVQVIDTGRGIGRDEIDRLFKPFSQVHDPKEVTERGTGLGLYISKGLVEHHRGRIWTKSEGLGRGSTFGFALALRDDASRHG